MPGWHEAVKISPHRFYKSGQNKFKIKAAPGPIV